MKKLFLVFITFGTIFTSCDCVLSLDKRQDEYPEVKFRVEELTEDDLNVFGEFPQMGEVVGDVADLESFNTCDEWAMFHNDGDDWRLSVTCAPWFDFDTIYLAVPVNINYNDTEAGTVDGMFHYMHGQKPDGLRWRQAEQDGVVVCDSYLSHFSAVDLDGDDDFTVSFQYDGTTHTIEDRRPEITNINDEGGLVYRVVFRVHSIPNDQYFAVYWQDDNSITN